MPHLRFRGLKLEELNQVSEELISELAKELDTPIDYFTVEHVQSIFTSSEQYPFVRVLWFDRGSEKKQLVANIITDYMNRFPYNDVCVYFEDLIKENYFENKEHF